MAVDIIFAHLVFVKAHVEYHVPTEIACTYRCAVERNFDAAVVDGTKVFGHAVGAGRRVGRVGSENVGRLLVIIIKTHTETVVEHIKVHTDIGGLGLLPAQSVVGKRGNAVGHTAGGRVETAGREYQIGTFGERDITVHTI